MKQFSTGMSLASGLLQVFAEHFHDYVHPERSGDNAPEEFVQSPIRIYVGRMFELDQIEVRVKYDAFAPHIVVTAEEYPNDVIGVKVRECVEIPSSSKVEKVQYDKTSGDVLVFVSVPEQDGGVKIPVTKA